MKPCLSCMDIPRHSIGAQRHDAPLADTDEDAWLDPEVHEQELLQKLLKQCPSSWLTAIEVSPLVNAAKNNTREVLEPATDLNVGRIGRFFDD